MSSVLTRDIFFVVVPRPGIRPGRGGENLVSPEELVGQETTGPAYQQQSQAAGAVLLYPFATCRLNYADRVKLGSVLLNVRRAYTVEHLYLCTVVAESFCN